MLTKKYKLNPARTVLFSILALLSLYVFYSIVTFYLNKDSDTTRLQSMSLILVPHGILGIIALVIGPFQFSSTLRARNIKLHRAMGKIYIIAILLSFPFAILLNIYYPIPGAKITFIFENITQASVWAVTALLAWIAAYKRQINIHKMWAARSYGVTLVFVLSRIYDPMTLMIDKPDINDFSHFLWFLLVFALIIPDVILFNKELFGPGKFKR